MALTAERLRQHVIEHPLQFRPTQAENKHIVELSLGWMKKFHLNFAPSPKGILEFHSVKQVAGSKQHETHECQIIHKAFQHYRLPCTSLPTKYQKFNEDKVKRKLTSLRAICGLQPFPSDCRLIELHHPSGDILYCDPLGQFSPIAQCSTAADWVNYEFLPQRPSRGTESEESANYHDQRLQEYVLIENEGSALEVSDSLVSSTLKCQRPFVCGSMKTLDFKDEQSVTLHFNRGFELTDWQIRTNHQMVRILRPFSTICPCIAISRTSMICENAGQDLSIHLAHGGSMSMSQFRQLCIDMGEIHQRNIILGDIKLANLAIQFDSAMVKMIDLDSIQTLNQAVTNYRMLTITPRYITKGLYEAIREQDAFAHLSRDSYALLLCMIQATTTAEIRTLINSLDGRQQKGLLSCIKVSIEQKNVIEKWVMSHFKSDHHQALFDFLNDPYKNSLVKPLSQMLA
ncbi:MAG: hypothetical protein ACPGUD_01420 [Parashewanella sp.]